MEVGPLEEARIHLGLSVLELWLAYFSLGGVTDAAELGAYLTGDTAATSAADHDAIVQALNEALADRGEGMLAYSST
jgi:hypothetical protein